MSADFELGQLRCFVAVAEELSFRGAARRLNMTQPPLSRQVAQLEAALAVRLFERDKHSVRLTDAGTRFLVDARALLAQAASARDAAQRAGRGEAGAVSLGFVTSAAVLILPRIVRALFTRMPAVRLSVTEMISQVQIEALRAGRIDIGIVRLPPERPDLEVRPLYSEALRLALPRSHPLAARERLEAADLNGIDFIDYSAESGSLLHDLSTVHLAGLGVRPRRVLTVLHAHTMMGLVEEGIGTALVPASSAAIRGPNTVLREIELPAAFRSDTHVALRRGDVGVGPGGLVERVVRLMQETVAAAAAEAPEAGVQVASGQVSP